MRPTQIHLFMALACALSFGCAGQLFTSSKMVTVSDIRMVVGRWDGIVEKRPLLMGRGPLALTIREDSVYVFVGVDFWEDRLLAGTGELTMRDGRLYIEDEKRRVVLTLYKRGDEDILVAEATSKAGKRFHIEFTRSPMPPLT